MVERIPCFDCFDVGVRGCELRFYKWVRIQMRGGKKPAITSKFRSGVVYLF